MRYFVLALCLWISVGRADHETSGAPGAATEEAAAAPDRCPAWAKEKDAAPPCPKGSTVLPDTYPALAHVVSDDFNPHYGNWAPHPNVPYWTEIKSKMAVEFTLNALKSSDPKTPLFYLPVHETTLKLIREAIGEATKGDSGKRKRWLGALVPMKSSPYVYLQDPMKAVRGQTPGTVELRPIPSHLKNKIDEPFTVEAFAEEANKACPLIRLGSPITLASGETQGDGHAGGNIVGLPGGLVTRSNNHSPAFAHQYSGGKDNLVGIETDWLYVGHADEVINTIANPRGEAPCNFAIAVASPRKAMELLSDEKQRALPFVEAPAGSKVVTLEEESSYRNKFSLWWLCNPWTNYQNERLKVAGKPEMTYDEEAAFLKKCSGMNTGEVVDVIKQFPQFSVTYELTQQRLDGIRDAAVSRITEKIPACRDKIKVVEVPVLYQPMFKPIELTDGKPGDPVEKRYVLPKGAVRAWLPNMVNGVGSGNSLISPFPHNKAFREYMQNAMKEMGAESRFADDYYYAHLGSGNVHCATHTMRFCQ